MSDENERIEGIKQYIDATITEIDNHTENMEKLFRMDKWSDDKENFSPSFCLMWLVFDSDFS